MQISRPPSPQLHCRLRIYCGVINHLLVAVVVPLLGNFVLATAA